jgi:cobalt/nickel transport system permease protein
VKIVDIDYYAQTGTSLLHKTSTWLKLLWALMLVSLVVLSNDLKLFAFVYSALFLYVVFSKLPARIILPLSLYPLIFVALFILSASPITFEFSMLLILKVLVAATSLILLFTTTPYKELFIQLSKILPGFLTTALFLTYRAVFILATTLENIMKALYLRGGLSIKNPRRSFKVIGNSVGFLVIRSIETSENMYEAMRLRGHNGNIKYLDESQWKK